MNDEEDVKKMIEVLNCSKKENVDEFQYEEFINCDSDVEDNCCKEELMHVQGENYVFDDTSCTDISKLNKYEFVSSLKLEERRVIDACSDPELKKLLLLNRTKNIQLIQLYKKIKDILIDCQKNIAGKAVVIKDHVMSSIDRNQNNGVWRLGAPYFKDKQLYSCPVNADVIRKKNNNELFIYDLCASVKWTKVECDHLLRAVKLNYNINQQNEILKRIKELNVNSAGSKNEVKELEKKLTALKENENCELPPLNSNKNINWIRISQLFLREKRSDFECQSFWHIYLHPSINKSPWTQEENKKLKKLVDKYQYQNWDQIAKELTTNRTAFTACVNYYSNLHEKFKRGEFTLTEDSKLVALVNSYRMGSYIPWGKIVHHFKNRTRSQLHYRYTYYLSQNNVKKGKFSEAEDVILMIAVDKFGRNFKKCCEYLPNRSMVQCKARYSTNLQKNLKKGLFEIKEDEIILKHVREYGEKSWRDLAKILQRSRGQIRQRYNTIVGFLEYNPDATLMELPRRKYKELKEEETFPFLRLLADRYKDVPVIPTVEEVQRILNAQGNDTFLNKEDDEDIEEEYFEESDIDDMLIDFFCNSFKIKLTRNMSSHQMKQVVKDVGIVLNMLKTNLVIPENIIEDSRLDCVDVAILENLFRMQNASVNEEKNEITDLIPPNLNSVVGLRSLLIKFSQYRSKDKQETTKIIEGIHKQHSVSNIRYNIAEHLLLLPYDLRRQVEADLKLFYKRFHVLFKWPAIMTLQGPSRELQNISQSITYSIIDEDMERTRTYSRTHINDDKNSASLKRTKTIPNSSNNLQNNLENVSLDKVEVNRTNLSEINTSSDRTKVTLNSFCTLQNNLLGDEIDVRKTYSRTNLSNKKKDKASVNNTDNFEIYKIISMNQMGIKKTYSRKNSTDPSSSSVKTLKLSETPSTSASPLKLTPVTTKSVIENLLKDKNKKLFSFEKINCSGKIKAIVKEIPVPRLPYDSNENGSDEFTSSTTHTKISDVNNGDCFIIESDDGGESIANMEDKSIVDDVEDIEKLDIFLKKERNIEMDDDEEDLQKLDTFLKQESVAGND